MAIPDPRAVNALGSGVGVGVGVGVAVGVGVGVDVGVAEGVTVGDAVGVGPGWQTLLPPGPEHWLEQQLALFVQEAPAGEQNGVGVAVGVVVGVAVGSGTVRNALLYVVVGVRSSPERSTTPSVGPLASDPISNVPVGEPS